MLLYLPTTDLLTTELIQKHRSDLIDGIRGARATQQPFTPPYAIELTPTGPISAPPEPRHFTYHRRAYRPGRGAQPGGQPMFTTVVLQQEIRAFNA